MRLTLSSLLALLECYIAAIPRDLVVATDDSVCEEKSAAGIFFPSLNAHYPVRLPDHTPVLHAEFSAIVIALHAEISG